MYGYCRCGGKWWYIGPRGFWWAEVLQGDDLDLVARLQIFTDSDGTVYTLVHQSNSSESLRSDLPA